MKYNRNNTKRMQALLVVLVWLLLFAIPVLFSDASGQLDWPHILKIWKEYSMLLVVFMINRFVLMPLLFFRDKKTIYFISIACVILMFTMALFFLQQIDRPQVLHDEKPPRSVEMSMQPDGPPHPRVGPPDRPAPGRPVPPFANMLIMSVLLVGFDSGLMFFSKWMVSKQNLLKAEKKSIENKMAFLKNQISPHFFMNTLNNIHALVDIDTEETKDAIIKLSHMMDYMLYESQAKKIPLKKEIEFIRSYVELMKLRVSDEVDLRFSAPEILPPVKIPPLLVISFIENAFKYGVSYQNPSFIHILVEVKESMVVFKIENQVHNLKNENTNSGIGIENTSERLQLLYGNQYELIIDEKDEVFKVNLAIPI